MKQIVDEKHRRYFEEQGFIQFEALLTPSQLSVLNDSIDTVLAERLKLPPQVIHQEPESVLYMAGRDLWRDSEPIKKIVASQKLAKFAAGITGISTIRLGYDQLLESTTSASLTARELPAFNALLDHPQNLNQISCIQGLLTGLFICLQSLPGPINSDEEMPYVRFPTVAGEGIFVNAELPLNLDWLYRQKRARYLLITYAEDRSNYVLRQGDPHTHVLKRLGYGFGDSLGQATHPILCR
jgi:hypothetical protein